MKTENNFKDNGFFIFYLTVHIANNGPAAQQHSLMPLQSRRLIQKLGI